MKNSNLKLQITKAVVLLVFVVCNLSFVISPVEAHLAGQPPFFKLNGVYSALYDVPTSSYPDFRLPQDKPPALYLVGEVIRFEIDKDALPVPPEIVAVSEFDWDWGDGSTHASGMVNTHAYAKPGSYFLEITAKTKDVNQPQLIQSTLVHIVPTKDYQLPQAKILVNGKGSEDPLLDDIKLAFGQDFVLDGSQSEEGTTRIKQYLWDLGDGKSKIGKTVTYQYGLSQYAFFPVLRVTDENGLFSDAFIQITNAANQDESVTTQPTLVNHLDRNRYFIIGGIVVGLLLIAVPYLISKRKKRH